MSLDQQRYKEVTAWITENDKVLIENALKFTKNNDTALDLKQETIFKALKNLNKYNAWTNIKSWIFVIMKRIFIDEYRTVKRRKENFDKIPRSNSFKQTTTANEVEETLSNQQVRSYVERIPNPIHRRIITLRMHSYSSKEIWETVWMNHDTVRSQVRLIKIKIAKMMLDDKHS